MIRNEIKQNISGNNIHKCEKSRISMLSFNTLTHMDQYRYQIIKLLLKVLRY